MKILSKLTIKTMFQNKKRTILTLIGIIVSCILLFSVALAGSTYFQNNIYKTIDLYGDQHAIISNADFEDKELLNDKVDKYYYLSYIEEGKINNNNYSIYGVSENIKNLIGQMPNSGEVLISNQFAKRSKLEINDLIGEYKIVGIYEKTSFLNAVSDTVLLTKGNGSRANFYIYMNSYNNIYKNIEEIQNEMKRVYENPTLEQLNDVVKLNMNDELLENYVIVPNHNAVIQQVMILVLMFIMFIIAFIVLFVIYNAFAISVNERKKMYGMYKSIGATPRQILWSVLLEALILTLIALPIGFILSVGFVNLIITVLNNYLVNIISYPFVFYIVPLYVVMALLYIIACVFIACISPAKRASEASPILTILQNTEYNKKGALFKKNKLVRKLFGIEGVISSKNSTRNFRKYNVTTFSIAIGCLLFIISTVFLNMYAYIETLYMGSYLDIITFEVKSSEFDNVKQIFSKEEVDNYTYFMSESGLHFEFNMEDINPSVVSHLVNFHTSIYYFDEATINKIKQEFNITNNDPILIGTYNVPKVTEQGIEIGREKVEFFNKKDVQAQLLNYDNELVEQYDHINVIDNYGEFLRNEFSFIDVYYPVLILPYDSNIDSYVTVCLKGDAVKLDKEIKSLAINEDMYTNNPLENMESNQKMKAVRLVIYSAICLIAFITITSIVNTITTNLELRRREFAVLRSIGLNKKGFNKMILYESLMLSIKSLVFGILFSLLAFVVFLWLFSFDITVILTIIYVIPKHIYILPFIICIFLVFILVYLSFYFATKKFKNDNIADVLKEM